MWDDPWRDDVVGAMKANNALLFDGMAMVDMIKMTKRANGKETTAAFIVNTYVHKQK